MRDLVITGARLIDGTGHDPIDHATVSIHDGTVVYAGPEVGAPPRGDATVLDAEGRTVLPGLIDCHMHFGGVLAERALEWILEPPAQKAMVSTVQAAQVLQSGFTTVRDISRHSFGLRAMFEHGLGLGPRVVACGPGLSRTGGHADLPGVPMDLVAERQPFARIVDGPSQVRTTVRDLIRQGADAIKLWVTGGGHDYIDNELFQHLDDEEIAAAIREADSVQIPVAAHCESLAGTKAALRAGIKTLEHGEELDEECLELMRANDVTMIPTLQMFERWMSEFEPPYRSAQDAFSGENRGAREFARIIDNLRVAREAGIRIASGSDTTHFPYGGPSLRELQVMVARAGMSPMEAILAATANAAVAINRADTVGQLLPGFSGDFVIFDADPLETFEKLSTDRIFAVGLRGELVRQSA